MTAQALQGDREHFLEAGMNDNVSKPASPTALILAAGVMKMNVLKVRLLAANRMSR